MKNKKITNLRIVMYIITIVALFLVTLTGCEQKTNDNTNNPTEENQITTSLDNSNKNELNLILGNYTVQPDEKILGDILDIMGDEGITFLEGNEFDAYIGFGNGISGTYTISDSKIDCVADTFYSEYGPNQKINASMSFKINSDSEIEVIDTTESFEINLVDIPNNSLMDETKDMFLRPFEKGIKFVLSE